MGGTPLTALAITCFPRKADMELLGAILKGGQRAMNEAGVIILGGHTIDDTEIKFGYAVTGTVDPRKVVTNAGAKPGDALILTKPIGTGAVSTGIKRGIVSAEVADAALKTMMHTAREASQLMQTLGANACTDITGFGLLGHAFEIANASQVTLCIESAAVPLLPSALNLIRQGMLTRGDVNNREYVGDAVAFNSAISPEMQSALYGSANCWRSANFTY